MPRLRPLSVLLLLGLMLAACSGDDHAPTSKDSSAEADVAAAADSHPPADIGDETATTDGVAGDVPADLPPPPSPWLRPWRCTAMVITTTENSHGENPLDEFALGVTEDAEGDLVLQIGHYLYETCLMTWIVDGDGATLAPLACADNQFPPNEYTFSAGTAAVGDAELAVEISGSKLHGRSGTLYTMTLTLDCVGCPYEPCGLACEWGICCGGVGEPCCDAKDECAGDMECTDGACAEPGPIPCDSNFCEDNGLSSGWHCDGDTQHHCTTLPNDCFGPILSDTQDCGPGACDAATGTCNGCDVNDPCFGMPQGGELCDGNGGDYACGDVDGCPGITKTSTCTNACVAGSGCCGSADEPCCAAMGDFCEDGLSCQAGVCQ